MPVSAGTAAGIIRNVLPRKVIQLPPNPVTLGIGTQLRPYQTALLSQRNKTVPSAHIKVIETVRLVRGIHTRARNAKSRDLNPPPFKVGRKKVYLPDIVITLQRNTKLEPYYAVFEVPLNLSKLDLRDYLWHLYNVKVLSVRSSVLPGRLRTIRQPEEGEPRWGIPIRRTQARKKMIVELADPFTYPRKLRSEEFAAYVLGLRELIVDFRKRGLRKLGKKEEIRLDKRNSDFSFVLILCMIFIINGVRYLEYNSLHRRDVLHLGNFIGIATIPLSL
jgi:ribosomal protein L23